MSMDNKSNSTNNIVIESLRKYVAFLIGLKSIFLSFVEERASRTGGNVVARIAYSVMSGSILLQIAKEEFINFYESLFAGEGYVTPNKVDFFVYIRCVYSSIVDSSSDHDKKWDKYLQKLMREEMCNRTAVAYSIPYDASTRRCYGHETFVWLLTQLPPKFVSMFLSDTYYKKMGFGDFFGVNGNNQDIEKVIEDSCLRTGFTVFLEEMIQKLRDMEKRNQEASLSDLYSFISVIGQSVTDAVDDLKEKHMSESEQLKDMVHDIGVHLENIQFGDKSGEESKKSLPVDAWKEMPFYIACQSIGAVFPVEGEASYLSIDSIEKFAKKIIEHLNKEEKEKTDQEIKLALCSIPSNEELVRRLWSRKKGSYMQLKATSFNQNMTEARRLASKYKRIIQKKMKEESKKEVPIPEEQKSEEPKQDNTPKENKLGIWPYAK